MTAANSPASVGSTTAVNNENNNNTWRKQRETDFKVLTYNFWIRAVPFVDEKKDERIAVFEKTELMKWDLIFLQELFSDLRGVRTLKRWREQFNLHIYSMPLNNLQCFLHRYALGDGGISIISKYPLYESDYHCYTVTSTRGCEFTAAKGVVYSIIYPGNGKQGMHVFNTHLHASYSPESYSKDKDIRMQQINELVTFMQKKVFKHPDPKIRSFPVMLAGDFNVNARPDGGFFKAVKGTKHTGEYLEMMDILAKFNTCKPVDVLYESYGEHLPTFEVYKDRQESDWELDHRLDYIFMWDGLGMGKYDLHSSQAFVGVEPFFTSAVRDQYQLSDHFGVSASFPLNR